MIIYILSDIYDARQFEWIVNSHLNKNQWKIKFILINHVNSKLKIEDVLKSKNSLISSIRYKSFFSQFLIFIKLLFILKKYKPIAIHCHLRKAVFFGIISGYLLRIKKRIFTRHHGNENQKNLIRGLFIDNLLSNLSTDIIAISKVTANMLKLENPKSAKKINIIHHGFNFNYFTKSNSEDIIKMKKKYDIKNESVVIGSVSRFIDWKGIEYTIEAFKMYLVSNPGAILILANIKTGSDGPHKNIILKKLQNISIDNYRLVEFERDVKILYQIFDLFIHVPIEENCEAFGQVYIESLALKIPSIFTLSGVGLEFLEHKRNCYICNYKDSHSINRGINFFLKDSQKICSKIINEGYKDVSNLFSLNLMLDKLDNLYKK